MTKEELLTVLMMDFDEMCFAPTAPECIHAEAYAREWKRALVDVIRACYAQNGCTESEMPKNVRWIPFDDSPKSQKFVCEKCGEIAYYPQPTRDEYWVKHCPYQYCPNCGARMKGAEQ